MLKRLSLVARVQEQETRPPPDLSTIDRTSGFLKPVYTGLPSRRSKPATFFGLHLCRTPSECVDLARRDRRECGQETHTYEWTAKPAN